VIGFFALTLHFSFDIPMNYLKRALPFILMLALLCPKQVAAQESPLAHALTLSEAWERAEAANKTLQIQALKLQISEQHLKEARTARLPALRVAGDYGHINNMPVFESGLFDKPAFMPVIHKTYTAGAEAYLNLYSGHQVKTAIKKEEVAHHLANEQKELTVSEIKLQVASVYLDLQRNCIFTELIKKNIEEGEKRLEQIKELHKHGVVLRSDLLRAELQLSQQRMTLVEITNSIVLANQKLDILIGLPDTVTVAPADKPGQASPDLPGSYENYLEQAFEQAFALKISEKEKELSVLNLKEIQAKALPKVGLFANYKYSYPQIFLYPYADAGYMLGIIGLKATYDVSSLYHNKHQVKAAGIEVQRQLVAHAETEDQVRQTVKQAYVRYQESLERIQVAQLSIQQASENYRIVNNSYFNQTALVTDLLDADTQVLQTRFSLAAAQLASRFQYCQLLHAIGKL
jgi:outer membrane protein